MDRSAATVVSCLLCVEYGCCGQDQVGHVRGVGQAGYGTLWPRDTGAWMGDNPCLTAVHAR